MKVLVAIQVDSWGDFEVIGIFHSLEHFQETYPNSIISPNVNTDEKPEYWCTGRNENGIVLQTTTLLQKEL